MANSRVKRIQFVLDGTITWATNTLTVVTTVNHNLVTGDLVSIAVQNSPQEIGPIAVTVTNATTFTVAAPATWQDVATPVTINGHVTIQFFRTATIGRYSFTAPRPNGLQAVIQSFVVGTGAASYTVDGSLDNQHWTNIATVTHGAVTNDTQFATVVPAWTYLSVNITAIGASTTLTINYSA